MFISLEKTKRECSSNQVYDSSWTPMESWKSGVCWNIIPQTWVLSGFWDDLGDLTWISDCTLWLKIKSQQCSLGKDQGTVGSCPLSAQAARFGNLLTKLTGRRDDESKIWYTDQHTKMQEGTEKPDKAGKENTKWRKMFNSFTNEGYVQVMCVVYMGQAHSLLKRS